VSEDQDFFLKLCQKYSTPKSVQKFLQSIPYNSEEDGETVRSAYAALEANKIHCLEASFLAAAILEHAHYPPMVMSLESQDGLDHVLFLYKEKMRWGAVARSRDAGLEGRKPIFKSLKALAASYIDPYVDGTGRVTGYGVASFDDVQADWKFSKRNLWSVENYLIELPHKKINCSESRYQKLLKRFELGLTPLRRPHWL
jgi:hypothetical protein